MKRNNKLHSRREAVGWIFILPWFIGTVVFFIQPTLSLLRYSFSDFVFSDNGYSLLAPADGLLSHYRHAFIQDAYFPQHIFSAFRDLLYQTPVVVFFSLFAALLLSRKFRGRTVMRVIFFLPIIITSGVLAEMLRNDMSSIATMPTSGASNLFDVTLLTSFLLESGIPETLVGFLTTVLANLADLVWKSGIQILIFLAALLAIPASYYEVARVEGATGWETFWKITFPIVSPFVLANLVYTIVDSFTNTSNQVMKYISEYFIRDMNYSYAAAMSWIYFAMIIVVIGLIFLMFRKTVFYQNQ